RLLLLLLLLGAVAVAVAVGVAARAGLSAPTNVVATSSSATSVTLTWDASPDSHFSYFAVRRSTNPKLDIAQWERLTPNYTAPTATDNGLTSGTTYYYYVTEIDSAKKVSARSNIASATPTVTTDDRAVATPTPSARPTPIYNANWTAPSDSRYFSEFSNFGSTVHPSHGFTSEQERHPGQRSWRVVSPPTMAVGDGNPARIYGRLRSPTVRSDGTERWYGVSFRIGADWNLDEIRGSGAYFCALAGFRYTDGQPNGPGGWIGCHNGTMVARGVIIDPDTVVTGSDQYLGDFMVKERWVDAIAHIKWSIGSDGLAEFWTKFADQSWDSAVFTGRYSGPTDYWTSVGGPHYDWIGYYGGDSITTTRTVDYGPWRVGTSWASVDPANPAP
ncbi:MAG: fibronectin type III domain-containing protein, partial [Propionibacteriaceae bacterium]|nr:fibronectin type III domain-containing protein [Propionibacteriaceae bacterium]